MKATLSENRSFLMGLAMIAIVCFHHGWQVIPGFTAFFSRFGLWGVDIFLFLSGFGCVYALNKYKTSIFFRKRIIRLLPTCLICGIMVALADLYFHAERTHTYLIVQLFSIHRWYIQTILICYLIAPVAYIIIKRYRVTGLFVLIALSIIIELSLPEVKVWKINWAFGRLPVFLIGMYIAEFDLKMKKWQYILSGLCLIGALVTRCGGGYYVFRWTYLLALAMPFMCETLCRLRTFALKLKIYRPIEIIGLFSLEIYLIHEYMYWAMQPMVIPLWSKYILFLGILVLLCYLVRLSTNYLKHGS